SPLSVLTFTHKFQLLTKEKEAKRKSYNNNNHSFLEITNLKEGGRMYFKFSHTTTFGVGKRDCVVFL
ncbi:MAG: hypothetical protein K9G42_03495, partial [Pedobacter sp.]|nr:hypothetical protein [Pedobacter sp.]